MLYNYRNKSSTTSGVLFKLKDRMMTENNFSNNESSKRYELLVEGRIAYAEYIKTSKGVVYITKTLVPIELEGKGVASKLVNLVLEDIKKNGQTVVPQCPFVKRYIALNPEWGSLVENFIK